MTGFALGIFVLGAVVILSTNSIAVAATAMNFMTLATGLIVVLPQLRHVHWQIVGVTSLGLLPATGVGVLALGYLGTHAQLVLRALLGLLIVTGGLLLLWKPQHHERLSRPGSFIFMGTVGGMLGGLFSIPAPPWSTSSTASRCPS